MGVTKEMRASEKLQALTMRRAQEAWEDFLSTPEGRLAMFDLLLRCGVNAAIVPGEMMAFQEGRRSVGLEVKERYLDPQGARIHAQMLIEAEERAQEVWAAIEAERKEDEGDDFGSV